jgi:EAL domain-containing protein (putative c-di-GMP-specific phosphodiesterase class I)
VPTTGNPLSSVLSTPPAALGSGNVDKVLHAVRTHLGMDVAFVSEFRSQDRVFRHVDAKDRTPIQVGDTALLENGYCQRVIDGRLPELMSDTAEVPGALALPDTRAIPIGAHLSVPIRLGDGRLYGTFCCFSFARDATLSQRDLQMMKAFAELLALQIDQDLDLTRTHDEKVLRITGAIADQQPSIVYQPIHNLETDRVAGLECLSRFQHVLARTPDVWFSEAKEVGLGIELELHAIRLALMGLSALPNDVYLAINSSPETISSGALRDALHDIDFDRVVIEITEHDQIADYTSLLSQLKLLRAQGARVAIDDAGAGYSSMKHILNIEPDLIKLDISLTRDIDRDPKRRALASALIAFAHETGSVIVAEGVETEAELKALQALGVHRAQGYFLARPLPLTAAAAACARN